MSSHLLKPFFLSVFLTALSWITIIPLWQYPDEQAHFAQVQNIAESAKSPVTGKNTSIEIAQSEKILGTERDESGNNRFTYHPEFNIEYTNNYFGKKETYLSNLAKSERRLFVKTEATSNPPLYYTTAAFFYQIAYSGNLFDRVYAVRILSVFYFLLNVFFTYKIGQLTFKNNLLALYFASLIAFMPMFIYSSTGILPDPLTNLLFTLMIFLSIKTMDKLKKKTLLAVFVTVILGTLTRQQFLISLPIFLVALGFQFYRQKRLKKLLTLVLAIAVVLILIEKFGTPYPIVGNFRISDISNFKPELLFTSSFVGFAVWSLKHTYSEVLPWYWGVYRWLSLTLPHITYQIINRMLLVCLIGFFIYILKIIKLKKINQENRITIFMSCSVIFYFLSLLIWDFFFTVKNNYSFGFQGRYYFPVISSEFLIIFIGFKKIAEIILKNNIYHLFFVLLVLMVIFCDYSLIFIASSYYSLASPNTFIIQASQYKPIILKGEIMYLIFALAAIAQFLFIFFLGKATLKEK